MNCRAPEAFVYILVSAFTLLVSEPGQSRVIGVDDAIPVSSLAPSDPIRLASRSIGQLKTVTRAGLQTCTAVIISERHILTASFCVNGAQDGTMSFGEDLEKGESRYPVHFPPAEINSGRGYAVLEVEGAPSQKFGAARLLLRIPLRGEPAFVLGVDHTGQQRMAANCSVVEMNDSEGQFLHDCDTTAGSSGALIFSAKDKAVLGLHIGTDQNLNKALPMYSIALASDLIREIATIRPTIDFRTIGNKAEDVAFDFSRLYLTLHNSLRLPVRLYQVDQFKDIETTFRLNGLFYGSPFPVELDSLACDLNVDVCSREKIAVKPEELTSLTAHVSGFKPSVGRWEVPAPRSLYLPNVKIEQQRDWVLYRKRRGEDISEVVTREFRGCEKFDDECRDLIIGVNRNREERLSPEYAGSILLPKVSFSARDLDISTGLEKGGRLPIEIKSADPGSQLVLQPSRAPASSTTKSPEPDFRVLQLPGAVRNTGAPPLPPGLDAVFKALGTTASGSARVGTNSVAAPTSSPKCKGTEATPCEMDPPDFSKYQQRFLDGINFPYRKLDDFPDLIKEKGGGRLGIIDAHLDLGHCALDSLRSTNRLVAIGIAVPPTAAMPVGHEPCKWLKPQPLIDPLNHGTHVAGLMVGKVNDQTWGLNPFATLYAGQITTNIIGQQVQVSSLDLANLLRSMLEEAGRNKTPLDVVNLSMFYRKEAVTAAGPSAIGSRPKGDPVIDVIRAIGVDTLFVVAAGNDGEDFTAICDMRPACLDLPNVISVAALGATPATLYTSEGGGSNYGRRVHVAAPGGDVLSLINGNYLGLLSGTSQAAPQVAAIASLLRALNTKALPADIKERLIACSSPIPPPATAAGSSSDEDEGAIFGGGVDATCAIRPDGEGMLQTKDAGEILRVRRVASVSDLTFKPIFEDFNYDVQLPPKALRGLLFNDGEFTVFHKRIPEAPWASLSKNVRLRLSPETQILQVEIWDKNATPPGWKLKPFAINNIARFVAPLLKRN